MAAAGTITLPGPPYAEIPRDPAPGLRLPVPGGAWGLIAIPSPNADPTPPPGVRPNTHRPVVRGLVPGWIGGPIPTVLIPWPVADPAQYQPIGWYEDNASNFAAGAPTPFVNQAYVTTNASVNGAFNLAGQATTAWSTNQDIASARPVTLAPVFNRHNNGGHYRREQFVNEQRFRWGGLSYDVIRDIAVRNILANPRMNSPYWPRLSNYVTPSSYSATTEVLNGPSANILPQPYGAY